MKKFSLFLFLFLALQLRGQNHWTQKAGGIGFDIGNAIASDASGNVYVTGTCFDNGMYGSLLVQASFPFSNDVFVASYNDEGIVNWARQWGGGSVSEGLGIHNSANGLTVCGSFMDSILFDGTVLHAAGAKDIFVCSLDHSGTINWAVSAGGPGNDKASRVCTDPNGNVYVTGSFTDSITFNGTSYFSYGGQDIFLAKYDPNGSLQWVRTAGGSTPSAMEEGRDVTCDANGKVYITGLYADSSLFDGTPLYSNGGYDVFVACYDPSGNLQWVKGGGGTSGDAANAITIAPAVGVLVGGYCYTSGTIQFGPLSFTGAGGNDIFACLYDFSGNEMNLFHDGGADDEELYDMDMDSIGNLYVTGRFLNNAFLGGTNYSSHGFYDVFAAVYDAAGNVVQCHTYGGSDYDEGHGITVIPGGNGVTTGWFGSDASFENTSLTSVNADVFVATLYNTISNTQGFQVQQFHTSNSTIGSNNVTDLVLDAGGNPWVAFSDSGLAHYDGSNWVNYTTLNSGLPTNQVNGLYIDSAGTVWAATKDGGIAGYDGVNWTVYDMNNSTLPTNSFSSLTGFHGNPSLWTGSSYDGCIRFNLTSGVSTAFNTGNSAIPEDGVSAMAADSAGGFWIGTDSAGAGYFSGGFITPYTAATSGLPDDHIHKIYVDGSKVWFATDGGVASFDGSTWEVFNSASGEVTDTFTDVVTSGMAGVFKGTKKKGTVVNDGSVQQRLVNTSNILFNNNVARMAVDGNQGVLWIATQYNGLVRLSDTTLIDAIPRPSPARNLQFVAGPNPARNSTQIRLDLPSPGDVQVRLLDIYGKECRSFRFVRQQAGVLKETVRLDDLPAGMYLLEAVNTHFTASTPLVIIE